MRFCKKHHKIMALLAGYIFVLSSQPYAQSPKNLMITLKINILCLVTSSLMAATTGSKRNDVDKRYADYCII